MISQIKGTVSHIDLKFAVVNTGTPEAGVGYKVFATSDTLSGLTVGSHTSLWTYLAVRDNAMDLYGFNSPAELAFFELLLTVSGIGPKTALGILNAAAIETIQNAIHTEDTSGLTKVSGIGKKVAEKIVLELKDKIGEMGKTAIGTAAMKGDSDVIEALRSLGYRENEAREAMKQVSKSTAGTSARIKEALKILGK